MFINNVSIQVEQSTGKGGAIFAISEQAKSLIIINNSSMIKN